MTTDNAAGSADIGSDIGRETASAAEDGSLLAIARRNGIPARVITAPHLEGIERAVDLDRLRRIVVVTDTMPIVLGRLFQARCPSATVTVLVDAEVPQPDRKPAFGLVQLEETAATTQLACLGSIDLLLDLRRDAAAPKARYFARSFLALSDGGHFVCSGSRPEQLPPGVVKTQPRDLIDWVLLLLRRRSLPPAERRPASTQLELGIMDALDAITVDGRLMVIRKRGRQVLKLDAEGTRTAFAARGISTREIARVEPQTVESAATIWSSDPQLAEQRLPGTDQVAELVCTAYRDVLCAPRQYAVLDGLLLPTSYFMPWSPRRRTFGVADLGPDFSHLPALDAEPIPLDGSYFHFDNQVAGHYGHVITHDLSKLWAWDAALAEYPDLKVLVSAATGSDIPSYTRELLAAYGIGEDRIVVIDRAVRVERLITATQGFQQPKFLSPVVRSVWSRVVSGLLPRAGTDPVPPRVFISRKSASRRTCRNGGQLEHCFADAGFAIVYPEDMALPDQARLFSSADVVAGYAGSGMINTVFSRGPATRIVFASSSYPATNEYHLAALYGGNLHYFWCDPVTDPGTQPSFHSDFRFDFDRNGEALAALLTG